MIHLRPSRPSGSGPSVARRTVTSVAVAALVGALLVPVAAGTATAAPTAAPTVVPPVVAALPAVLQDVPSVSAFDAELLRLINVARANAGVAPLQEARGLDGLSGWWSAQLAGGSGVLSHNPDGLAMAAERGAAQRTRWAENVAKLTPATAVDPQGLLDTYLASPTHKANLLDARFGYVGVGTVSTTAGVGYNTVNFTDVVDAGQTWDPRAAVTPVGQFESLALTGATVRVTGWAVEPGAASPQVTMTDTAPDGTVSTTATTAGVVRAGLADVYPTSSAHAFDASYVTGGRGTHSVCATVTDTGAGLGDVTLGCLQYTVGDPVGSFDAATLTGRTATVTGWAVDPDQPTKPATVTVSDRLGGGPATTTRIVADATNAGVDGAVRGAGPAHAFAAAVPVTGVGEHTLCTTVGGIRTAGISVDLGCRTVTVAPAAPVGSFDSAVSADRRTVTVAGWAADPDQPAAASTVTVAVTNATGTTRTTLTAGGTAVAPLPATVGQAHAFTGTVPLTATGTSTVCVTAVSRSGPTVTTDLGCRSVTVAWLHGWLDSVTPAVAGGTRTLAVRGWAIDQGSPTSAAPVTLTVTGPSGKTSTVVPAGALRADVGRAFTGTGDNHGYLTTLKVAKAGTYTVCATVASLTNPTQLTQLRCVPVTVN